MIFSNRHEAGKLLAAPLKSYQNAPNTLVVGLPRGGVVVAYEIAKELHLPLDIICPRKIGAMENPEYAIGAVTESGDYLINPDALSHTKNHPEWLKKTIQKESEEAASRLKRYRINMPKRNLKGKVIIIVDDGIATGSTLKAAILTAKREGAKKIIIAAPVAPAQNLGEFEEIADEVICLQAPYDFQAIGEFYHSFSPTTDQEVIELIQANRIDHISP